MAVGLHVPAQHLVLSGAVVCIRSWQTTLPSRLRGNGKEWLGLPEPGGGGEPGLVGVWGDEGGRYGAPGVGCSGQEFGDVGRGAV